MTVRLDGDRITRFRPSNTPPDNSNGRSYTFMNDGNSHRPCNQPWSSSDLLALASRRGWGSHGPSVSSEASTPYAQRIFYSIPSAWAAMISFDVVRSSDVVDQAIRLDGECMSPPVRQASTGKDGDDERITLGCNEWGVARLDDPRLNTLRVDGTCRLPRAGALR